MAPSSLTRRAAWLADHELWLLVLAAPLMLFPGLLPAIEPIAPWLGLVIALFAWLARWLATGAPSRRTPLDIPVLLLLAAAILGTVISPAPALSWNRLWSLVFAFLAYYSFANWLHIRGRLRSSLLLLAFLTLGVALLSLVATDWSKVRMFDLPALYDRLPLLFTGLPGSGVDPASDLFNPRWVGITLGFLLPPFAALWFWAAGTVYAERRLRWLWAAVVLVGGGVLLLTQALQGLLGLAAGLLFLLIWRWRWFWLVIPIGLLALLGGVTLIGGERIASFLLSMDNPVGIAVSLRLDIWSRALAMLHDQPYTGVGLNAFSLVQAKYYPGFALGQEPHAHNLALQTALDLGLTGLFAFAWLCIAWFVEIIRRYRVAEFQERVILVGLAAGVTSYLAHGFIDALMLGAKPGAALWIILALGVCVPPGLLETAPQVSGKTAPRALRPLLPFAILAPIGLILLVFQPGSLQMNRGAIRAQSALLAYEKGQAPAPLTLAGARADLQRALLRDPRRRFALEYLGQLAAWGGDHDLALAAYAGRASLDRKQPWQVYAPHLALTGKLQGKPLLPDQEWDQLISVYQNWASRYPQRSEHALRLALAWQAGKNDPAQARAVLQAALAAGAQPAAVLQDALERLADHAGLP